MGNAHTVLPTVANGFCRNLCHLVGSLKQWSMYTIVAHYVVDSTYMELLEQMASTSCTYR